MNSSAVDPATQRDRAMNYITKGKEIFNAAKTVNEKEQGYSIYKQGLEKLLVYLKSNALNYRALNVHFFILGETNAEIKQIVKDNFKGWMGEAEKMAAQIEFERGGAKQQEQKPTPTVKDINQGVKSTLPTKTTSTPTIDPNKGSQSTLPTKSTGDDKSNM